MLILGDSHSVGSFGEYLHKGLHNLYLYNIMGVNIGGAGTKHFTLQLRNFCCGYKIRVTHLTDTLTSKQTIFTLESSKTGDQSLVGKKWNGYLSSVLEDYKPNLVVFALGSNNVNAHQDLVNLIRKYIIDVPIIWVGPFKRIGNTERYKAIEKTIKNNKNIHLVRSDDILGHDTITSTHFYGKVAKNWANKVVDRMKPILNELKK